MNVDPAVFCANVTRDVADKKRVPLPPNVAAWIEQILTEGSRPGTDLVTARQFAAAMGVSKRAITERAEKLGGELLDGRWLFRPEDVQRAVTAKAGR